MESLIARGCVRGTCLSETAWLEIHRKLPRNVSSQAWLFISHVRGLLGPRRGGWGLGNSTRRVTSFSARQATFRPYRCHLSFQGLPDGLSEALTGAWRSRSFRGALMNGPRLKKDKSKSQQRKNCGEQEAQFQRFWKNPQSLSFNPSWQGWGSIHLTLSFSLFSLSLSFSPFSSGSVGSCSGGATAWVLRSVFCVLRDTHTEQLITMPCEV